MSNKLNPFPIPIATLKLHVYYIHYYTLYTFVVVKAVTLDTVINYNIKWNVGKNIPIRLDRCFAQPY